MTVVERNSAAQRALRQEQHAVPEKHSGAEQHSGPEQHSGAEQQSGPGAKMRILVTADRLFYEDGIRSVGIDRLIAESSVTKATFYKHYGSKDRLIAEYLKGRHQVAVDYLARLQTESDEPVVVLKRLLQAIVHDVQRSGFRGCPFINAAAEFSDSHHPVRIAVMMHRDWYTDTLVELLRAAGHEMPGDAADEIILARDGAMTGGYAGDPIAAAAALQRSVDRTLPDSAGADRMVSVK